MQKIYLTIIILFSIVCFGQIDETSKQFQDNLNLSYGKRKESPLTDQDFKTFKSLDFFEIDAKYVVEAQFIKAVEEKVFEMKTTTARLPKYKKFGELVFKIEGIELKLNVYQNVDLVKKEGYEDYLFLPFSDLTCGNQSYVGGRYIDLIIPKSNKITLDFNKAYNPYCAYNYKYSCPIVPLENDLKIAILAGVKKFN